MKWSYELLLTCQALIQSPKCNYTLKYKDPNYKIIVSLNNIDLQRDISYLIEKNQEQKIIQIEQRVNFSEELLETGCPNFTFEEAFKRWCAVKLLEDAVVYSKIYKQKGLIEYLLDSGKELYQSQIDFKLKQNQYQYLLVAKAILEGYTIVENVGKNIMVVTPNQKIRVVKAFGCDCPEWGNYGRCLHKAIFDTYNTHRPLFHKYNELIEFYD